MSKIFIVQTRGRAIAFTQKQFMNFCSNATLGGWNFLVGDINSNEPLVLSSNLKEKNFVTLFKPNKIKHLLKYKCEKFGNQLVWDVPLFSKHIHTKYGERIGWNEKY